MDAIVAAIIGYIICCLISWRWLIDEKHQSIVILDWVIIILTAPLLLFCILILAIGSPTTLKSLFKSDAPKDKENRE